MYHVLIVDDEIHAVRGLQAGVMWERLGIGFVHTAHSMKQAQEVFREQPVHLMVCDIEMPQGSGLELVAWVKERYPETETIFLTCHSDFSFAKQAIQMNSFDYMLKPVDYAELETVIGKALGKVEKEKELRSFEETHHRYRKLWESHRPVVAERFWQDLVHRKIPANPQAVQAHLRAAGLSFDEDALFRPMYIRVQRWHKELSERDRRIMEYALRNVLEEVMKEVPGTAVVPVAEGGAADRRARRPAGRRSGAPGGTATRSFKTAISICSAISAATSAIRRGFTNCRTCCGDYRRWMTTMSRR
ncbi:response regulator [Cohnella rhizosphaerae]|uniref:Response regulator n=1 Tax=Cohnella rhizosphaerae TaxID=1457232 RepID=A0A9X4KS47_9BACL|nr:response regulator [Cohnella rhizosphaerae]MDG0809855.1 response regulator [Cohnella rhizosphaerae]